MAMLEDPEVVKDAMDTWADLTVKCIDYYVKHGLDFDGVWFYGDMGYRNGTLFGPDVYRSLVMPAHSKIVDYIHQQGKKVILHSCGQIKSFLPMLIEVGFDAIQPLEAKCDQDVRELVKQYGRQIVFIGNIDVRALSADKEAISEEMESKLAAFEGSWNYVFHSDHSIPQTVTLENYRYALDLARGYLRRG
jgi:uroporphyrinogen decarboxylase